MSCPFKNEVATKIQMALGDITPKNGLGSKLLAEVMSNVARKIGDLGNVSEIYLHVQISNEEAIAFYKKFGFDVGEQIDNYYKRIDPPHAVVLRKVMRPPAA